MMWVYLVTPNVARYDNKMKMQAMDDNYEWNVGIAERNPRILLALRPTTRWRRNFSSPIMTQIGLIRQKLDTEIR
jgi:hypothetical protein